MGFSYEIFIRGSKQTVQIISLNYVGLGYGRSWSTILIRLRKINRVGKILLYRASGDSVSKLLGINKD